MAEPKEGRSGGNQSSGNACEQGRERHNVVSKPAPKKHPDSRRKNGNDGHLIVCHRLVPPAALEYIQEDRWPTWRQAANH
jgi:hypothetical protein